ncbi:hypothetical protein [Butyrivibrio sp. WCE2006]|uniref:hypothetical protein n=1 Tax=Butyrivibrio sp. WCE2006 TaxID=1410611 RepID=UPI000AF80E21|nr:hypothetical protein [Butyrivibrio sp. WCE2006]
MIVETDRLIIRDVAPPDGEAFIHMASDGSLNDVGFDKDCSSWNKPYEEKDLTEGC